MANPILTSGTIFAIAEESTFGAGNPSAWAQDDVVNVNSSSSFAGANESLERDILNNSYVMCPSVLGQESSSGSLDVELGVAPITGTELGRLKGHLLYKACLGKYVEAGASTSGTAPIEEVVSGGDADLYRLARIGEDSTSLAVREYVGGSGDTVFTYDGVVADSLSLAFTSGQILNASFSASGINYTPSDGETPLTSIGCGANPFVVKNCVFQAEGVDIPAMDVTLSINNTITDRNGITGDGITNKVATAKAVELSYTLDMEDISLYTKLKANYVGSIYIKATSGLDTIEFYLPKVNLKTVDKSDDSGIQSLSITSSAYNDDNGDAILIAVKKG